MIRHIPYQKLSKKKRRELDASKRGMWSISPVTRKPKNPKAYDRRTARKWNDGSFSVPFLCLRGIAETRHKLILSELLRFYNEFLRV